MTSASQTFPRKSAGETARPFWLVSVKPATCRKTGKGCLVCCGTARRIWKKSSHNRRMPQRSMPPSQKDFENLTALSSLTISQQNVRWDSEPSDQCPDHFDT